MSIRNLKAAVGVATLLAISGTAHATAFEFSYTFNTSDVITGSFDGTESGGLVTNLTDITARLNGTPLVGSGSLYAYSYTGPVGGPNCPTCFSSSGATAAFNAMDNNFLFSDAAANPTNPQSNSTNWFYIIPWANPGQTVATQYYAAPDTYIDLFNGQYIPANWSLTAVPEPAAWALMLIGFAGLGGALRAHRRMVTA